MAEKFQVLVLEGTREDDIATYYSEEQPVLLSMGVENQAEIEGVFVSFIPLNGLPNRVGKVNLVPADRIVAIVEPAPVPPQENWKKDDN